MKPYVGQRVLYKYTMTEEKIRGTVVDQGFAVYSWMVEWEFLDTGKTTVAEAHEDNLLPLPVLEWMAEL